MRAEEILAEALFDPEIKKFFLDKGYKYLGKGVDQMAFLEPDGNTVLKIYGTSPGYIGRLTGKQKSFKTFYDAIKKDPTNEFLPEIYDYKMFEFGKPPMVYLEIKMERLSKFKGGAESWNFLLANMAGRVLNHYSVNQYIKSLEDELDSTIVRHGLERLIIHLGTEGLRKMYKTIFNLYQLAKKNGYKLDLHDGNFMIDSDGNPVITDPFWVWDYGI